MLGYKYRVFNSYFAYNNPVILADTCTIRHLSFTVSVDVSYQTWNVPIPCKCFYSLNYQNWNDFINFITL